MWSSKLSAALQPMSWQSMKLDLPGRVVCIGYAKSEVSFQTKYFVQKELDIRGSRNALPADFRAVIRYMEQGTCPKDELISKVAKPETALQAMEEWAKAPEKYSVY